MPTVEESLTVPVSALQAFDVVHDYRIRLDWDPFLCRAELEDGATEAHEGVTTYCVARGRSGGLAMRAVYISYKRPRVAAVEMVDGPRFLSKFVASIGHSDLGGGRSRVSYKFNFGVWPRWLGFLIEPLFSSIFRRETRLRLRCLRGYLENRYGLPPDTNLVARDQDKVGLRPGTKGRESCVPRGKQGRESCAPRGKLGT